MPAATQISVIRYSRNLRTAGCRRSLEGLAHEDDAVRAPIEIIWNSLEEDAAHVQVSLHRKDVGGVVGVTARRPRIGRQAGLEQAGMPDIAHVRAICITLSGRRTLGRAKRSFERDRLSNSPHDLLARFLADSCRE